MYKSIMNNPRKRLKVNEDKENGEAAYISITTKKEKSFTNTSVEGNYNKIKNNNVSLSKESQHLNDFGMSVHNISMNATISTSLNLDQIYKHFANCIYKPREFKCIRIDVPVSHKTVQKYLQYLQRKRKEHGPVLKKPREPSENEYDEVVIDKIITTNDLNKESKESNCELIDQYEKKEYEEEEEEELEERNRCIELRDAYMQPNLLNTTIQEIKESTNEFMLDVINNLQEEKLKEEPDDKIIINVSIFANGKVISTGNNSIEACKIAMKKIEKKLKQLNFKNIKLRNITITNILAVYNVGFSIILPVFAQFYKNVDYDPNVFPACKVKIALSENTDKISSFETDNPTVHSLAWSEAHQSLRDREEELNDVVSASIFSTGNITLTGGKNYENLKKCVGILLPYLIKSKSQHS